MNNDEVRDNAEKREEKAKERFAKADHDTPAGGPKDQGKWQVQQGKSDTKIKDAAKDEVN